jgi:hypothetical protein
MTFWSEPQAPHVLLLLLRALLMSPGAPSWLLSVDGFTEDSTMTAGIMM